MNFNYEFINDLIFSGNMAYSYGNFSDTDSPLPFIPPLSSYLKLEWHKQKYGAYIDSEMAAEQNRTDQFELRTDGYLIFGMGLYYRINVLKSISTFRLDLDNITDRIYRNHLSIIRSIYPEPGFGAKLTWSLDI
jgi:iron complex outermembrane receptor protein